MEPNLIKSLAGLIVSFMTFLGWNVSEYSYLLPPPLREQIEIVESPKSESQKKEVAEVQSPKVESRKLEQNTNPIDGNNNQKEIPTTTKKPTVKQPIKKAATKTDIVIKENKITSTPTPPKQQPTYYPAPITVAPKETVIEIKETIKKEIKNIVDQIDPPKTETQIKKETENLSVEEKIKKTVVNIYCSQTSGNQIKKTTGSGVIIDEDGVILTNAHVAQYFLLAQNGDNTNCFVRTGSPAVNSYKAKLVYLPGVWVQKNKNNLSLQTLTGTGEYDYALLVITERVRTSAPNIPLTYLNTQSTMLNEDDNIFVAGYPAGFSDVKILDSGLYSLIKPSIVTYIASFSGGDTDVINTGATSVAEHGSSGGAVTDEDGNLAALIVATNIDRKSGGKNIQAITLPYIRRSIKENSGKSFDSLVSNARDEAISFEKNSVGLLANILLGN